MFMCSKINYLGLLMVAFSLLGSQVAEAASGPPLDLDQLAGYSGVALVGTVVQIDNVEPSGKTADEWPLTRYLLCDLEVVGGKLPQSLVRDGCFELNVLGGTMADGTGYHFAGLPRLAAEKRYLMFLEAQSPYNIPWVGWHQGVFEIRGDTDGGWLFAWGGSPIASITPEARLEAGPTQATWLAENSELNGAKIPAEIVAETPVSINAIRDEVSSRVFGVMPTSWRANTILNTQE